MVKMVGTLGAALAFTWLVAASAQAQTTTTPQDTTGGVEDSSSVQEQDAMTQPQSGSESIELSSVQGEQARQLQQKLKEQGLYNGPIDGILGPQSRRALEQFQEQQGFEGNGSLDQQTAQALGLDFDEIQRVRGTEGGQQEPQEQQIPQSGTELEEQEPQEQSGVEEPSGDVMPQPATSPASGEQESEEIDTQSGDLEQGDTATQPQSDPELEQDAETQEGSLEQDQIDPQSGTLGEEHDAGSGSAMTGGEATEQDPQAGSIGNERDASSDVEMQAGANLSADEITKVQSALKDEGHFTGTASGKLDDETKNAIRKFQRAQGIPETGNLDAATARRLGVELDEQVMPQSGTESEVENETQNQTDIDTQSEDVRPETEQQSGIDDVNEDATSPVTGGATTIDETEATSGQTGTGGAPMGGVESHENDPGVVDPSEIEPQAGAQTTYDKKTIKKVEKALKDRQIFAGEPDGVLDQETTDAIRQFQQQNGLTVTGSLDEQTLQALDVKVEKKERRDQRGQDHHDQDWNRDEDQDPVQDPEMPEGDEGGDPLPR